MKPMRGLLIALLGVLAMTMAAVAEMPALKPDALKPGDLVVLVAPAAPVGEQTIAETVQGLEKMGLRVRVVDHATAKYGYLAGTDEQRAASLNAAFADPEVKGVFPVTGGYGVTRILDKLDYEMIRKNPKVLAGYSDITGLHIALNQKSGLITFHGPNWTTLMKQDAEDRSWPTKWSMRAMMADRYAGAKEPGYVYDFDDLTTKPITMVAGKARGRLIGGNLSLVAAMMGTPYEIQTEGRILFLEDTREEPYRVDRMLSTLRLAGKLDKCAAVLLGDFTYVPPKGETVREGFTVEEVLEQYFGHAPYPVIAQWPTGHIKPNASLPVGALAEVDADARSLRLLENPVNVARE